MCVCVGGWVEVCVCVSALACRGPPIVYCKCCLGRTHRLPKASNPKSTRGDSMRT